MVYQNILFIHCEQNKYRYKTYNKEIPLNAQMFIKTSKACAFKQYNCVLSLYSSEMVGEREGILHKRDAGKTDTGDVTCTYSRRKGEKRAKFENENDVETADIEMNEIYEHQQLVDKFVQV